MDGNGDGDGDSQLREWLGMGMKFHGDGRGWGRSVGYRRRLGMEMILAGTVGNGINVRPRAALYSDSEYV